MNGAPAPALEYLGWSGLRIAGTGGELCIDPPAGAALALDRPMHALLTHGHPEHVAGTLAHLRNPARTAPVRAAAAAPVCRYLRRHAVVPGDQIEACAPGQRFDMAGFAIDVFEWQHMPLLPPGIGAALQRLMTIAARPRLAANIVLAGMRGPWPFPMLGFRLSGAEGTRILVYGEGLHRRTDSGELDRIREALPADLLLAAVEPEDAEVLPDLFRRIGAPAVGLYEAHRPWREAFGMPLADLDALAAAVAGIGLRAAVLRPGMADPATLPQALSVESGAKAALERKPPFSSAGSPSAGP